MDVFVHIPKSAGSTIRAILSREYGAEKILYYEPLEDTRRNAQEQSIFLQDIFRKREIRLITGHYPYGIHCLIKGGVRYFTMARDPIDRALSDYFYAYSYEHHRFREEVPSGRLTIQEFLGSERYTSGREQAELLAGSSRSRAGVAAAAIENIRNGLVAVGTAERFQESILLTAKALRWRPPLYAKKNVTRLDNEMQGERQKLREEARALYWDRFQEDYQVYRAVDQLVTERTAAGGAVFARALESFREIQTDISARSSESVFDRYEFHGDDPLPEGAARYVGSDSYRRIEEYIGDEHLPAFPARNYVGCVDVLSERLIAGWAMDLSGTDPIEVTLWRGEEKIAAGRCDALREDIEGAGFPTARAGFRIELSDPLGGPTEYSIRFENTMLELPRAAPPAAASEASTAGT